MKKKTILLAILYFIFGIAVNVIHPITPGYTEWLNLSDFYYGLLFSMMSLGQVVGAITFGRLSDKWGRLPLLCIGLFGYAFFQFCFGYWNQIPWLILLFRFGAGFFTSSPHVLFLTFVSDLESDKKIQARAFLIFNALYLIGSSLGYKVGGWAFVSTSLDYLGIFLIQVITVCVLSISLAIMMRKENRIKKDIEHHVPAGIDAMKQIKPKHLLFFLFVFLVAMAQIMTTKFVEKYMYFLSYNEDDLGNMMMVTGLLGLFINLLWSLVLKKKKFHFEGTYALSLLVSFLAILFTFIFSNNGFLIRIYTIYAVFIMAKSLSAPLEATMIQSMSDDSSKGLYLGIRQSFLSFGNFLGPLLGGLLYSSDKKSVFCVSALIFLVLSFTFYLLFGRKKKEKEEVQE